MTIHDGRVLVPLREYLDDAPRGLRVELYDGRGEPSGDLGDVRLYVLPYDRPDGMALLGRLPGLEALQLLTAGYDAVLGKVPAGVTVHNGAGLHDASTAEMALALVLAAQRDIDRAVLGREHRRWDRRFTRSLAGSRVLLIGYGGIGKAIEARLLPFETEVVRVASRARDGVHGVDELPALLPEADIVVLAVPHTAATTGLLGAAELALLPDDALVVNVGRGSALDTDALLAEKGRIRAALDVLEEEPPPADHPVWTAPGIILSPHVGGGSATFYPRARRFVADQLRRWAAGEPLANRVDL